MAGGTALCVTAVITPVSGLRQHICCRSIESEHFGSLALPVGEFLALEHGLEYWGISDHEQVQVGDRIGTGSYQQEPSFSPTLWVQMSDSETFDLHIHWHMSGNRGYSL